MLADDYNKLYPYPVEKRIIDLFYCNAMLRRKACPLTLSKNCNTCLPKLQALITELDGVDENTVERLIGWRLSQAGQGKLMVWLNEKKSIPEGLFRQERNPFEQLGEELG